MSGDIHSAPLPVAETESPGAGGEAGPGRKQRGAGWRFAGWFFPRALALVYLVAFASWGAQWDGLVGSQGILPAGAMMENVRMYEEREGVSLWWQYPTIFRWGTGDALGRGLCWTGCALSLLVLAGVAQGPLLLALWAGYLSLVVTGDVFMGFQWDALLLEAGLIGVLFAPWRRVWRAGWDYEWEPPVAARWLVWWLLFRLMFLSGLVKLGGGDDTWTGLRALFYHYQTQPLPNGLSWHAHQLPDWAHRAGCAVMFVIQLALPFAIVLGRWGRVCAAAGFTGLMGLIFLTGNYNFFNLLAIAMALCLLDDRVVRLKPVDAGAAAHSWWRRAREWPSLVLAPLFLLLTLTAADQFAAARMRAFGGVLPEWCGRWSAWAAPLRSFNGYGLFQSMTVERPEILIEGSADGQTWVPLEFKWKPGRLDRRPAMAAPHQPRLDWQMWFAALSPGFDPRRDSHPASPTFWFGRFMEALLRHREPVWQLLESPDIPFEQITKIRARLWRYEFATPAERAETGNWWKRTYLGIYAPELSLQN